LYLISLPMMISFYHGKQKMHTNISLLVIRKRTRKILTGIMEKSWRWRTLNFISSSRIKPEIFSLGQWHYQLEKEAVRIGDLHSFNNAILNWTNKPKHQNKITLTTSTSTSTSTSIESWRSEGCKNFLAKIAAPPVRNVRILKL